MTKISDQKINSKKRQNSAIQKDSADKQNNKEKINQKTQEGNSALLQEINSQLKSVSINSQEDNNQLEEYKQAIEQIKQQLENLNKQVQNSIKRNKITNLINELKDNNNLFEEDYFMKIFEKSMVAQEIYQKDNNYGGDVDTANTETHYLNDLFPVGSKLVLEATHIEYQKSCGNIYGEARLYYIDKEGELELYEQEGTGFEGVEEVDADRDNVEIFLNSKLGIEMDDFEEQDYEKILDSLCTYISNLGNGIFF